MANTNVRKTGKDYWNEFSDLAYKQKKLLNNVRQRLFELTTAYPDAVIDTKVDNDIKYDVKAKAIAHLPYIETYLSVTDCILYIEAIEKWLAEQNPIKQLEINF